LPHAARRPEVGPHCSKNSGYLLEALGNLHKERLSCDDKLFFFESETSEYRLETSVR